MSRAATARLLRRPPVPLVGQAVGLALIVAAWHGASSDVRVADQLPWVSVGAFGLAVAGAGNAAGLMMQRRDLRERRRRLEVSEIAIPESAPQRSAPPVAGAAMTRYHRPECQFVAGKPVQGAEAAIHQRAGRRPCPVCGP